MDSVVDLTRQRNVSRVVAVVFGFGGPDLALETANYVRRSHYSAPSNRFVLRHRSSSVETVVRDDRSPRLRLSGVTRVALLSILALK